MSFRNCFLASIVLVLSVGFAQADASLHWAGLGSGIGGAYDAPPTSGIGYGLSGYHEMWSCELVFDSVTDIPGMTDGSPLTTFCLEWNEDLIGNNDFTAVVNTGTINGGVNGTGFDPLDAETAYIYSEYLAGNTFGISDVNRRAAVVQEAIWRLEEELTWANNSYIETEGLIDTAELAVAGGWTNDYVRVLNVSWTDPAGKLGQDVLVTVPEPSTIVMLLIGAIAFLGIKRRR